MTQRSAILFLLDDTARTGCEKPLMLQNILGEPLLKWLTHSLKSQQVSRFFLVCGQSFLAQAKSCFPSGAELFTASDENPSDRLHVFLSTAEENEQDVLVITGPVVYMPQQAQQDPRIRPAASGARMVSRQALMDALDQTAPIGQFLWQTGEVCTDKDGFYSVYSPWQLPEWAPALKQALLRQLTQNGVEIWDYDAVWVAPGVEVGIGTALLPGTILQGQTRVGYGCIIGPNTQLIDTRVGNHSRIEQSRLEHAQVGNHAEVGPFARLEAGSVVAHRAKVGSFVCLNNTTLGEQAQVRPLSLLADAEIGSGASIGSGLVTANFDRVDRFQTTVEPEAFVGANTTLVAPITVGQGAYVGAGSVITQDVPAQSLGIARTRQQSRREWALKNKIQK